MQGVHTAVVTPFQADGSLDLPAFERLLHRQLEGGVHGIVPCGTTGETPTLTDGEWDVLVRTTVRLVRGRVPVTAGVGTNATRSTVRNVERAKEAGADFGLLVFPYYNKPNPAGLRAHVKAALAPGLPLVLYHVPGRTGQRLGAELLAELASVPGVAGVKEATGDLLYGGQVLSATKTPILSGDDFTFPGLMAIGGTGVISVVSNVDPGRTVRVWEHYNAGRNTAGAAEFMALWPLITFLFADTNPVPCKAALAELGLCGPDARLPLANYAGPSPRGILSALGLL